MAEFLQLLHLADVRLPNPSLKQWLPIAQINWQSLLKKLLPGCCGIDTKTTNEVTAKLHQGNSNKPAAKARRIVSSIEVISFIVVCLLKALGAMSIQQEVLLFQNHLIYQYTAWC